jgi:hypothetical protein
MPSWSLILAVAVVTVIAVAAVIAAPGREGYGKAPYNLGVYDQPHRNYPRYEGRAAVNWDPDNRCAAYCTQPPCTVWCR